MTFDNQSTAGDSVHHRAPSIARLYYEHTTASIASRWDFAPPESDDLVSVESGTRSLARASAIVRGSSLPPPRIITRNNSESALLDDDILSSPNNKKNNNSNRLSMSPRNSKSRVPSPRQKSNRVTSIKSTSPRRPLSATAIHSPRFDTFSQRPTRIPTVTPGSLSKSPRGSVSLSAQLSARVSVTKIPTPNSTGRSIHSSFWVNKENEAKQAQQQQPPEAPPMPMPQDDDLTSEPVIKATAETPDTMATDATAEVEEEEGPVVEAPPTRSMLFSSKYDPKTGFTPFDADAFPVLAAALKDFHEGTKTAQELSLSIIEILFERDFWAGEHWVVGDATVETRTDVTALTYAVSKTATWSWEDIVSEASAKADIEFLPTAIRIADYAYFVAG